MRHLETLLSKLDLETICDAKPVGETIYFRLCEKKVIEFLSRKIFLISQELVEAEDIESCTRSSDSLFFTPEWFLQIAQIRSSIQSSEKEIIEKAISILSEYIGESYVTKLRELYKCDAIGTKELTAEQREQYNYANAPQLFSQSRGNGVKNEAVKGTTPKTPKQTATEKGRQDAKEKLKLRPITSFFSPAPKKSWRKTVPKHSQLLHQTAQILWKANACFVLQFEIIEIFGCFAKIRS
jgi:hypothetical protein